MFSLPFGLTKYGDSQIMIDYTKDDRTVLTLDAGGTNMVFSAIRGLNEVAGPITLPTEGHSLELCLRNMKKGFMQLISELSVEPAALSFAFPGPANYARGIIRDLPNLPAFSGGVALGPILEEEFKKPVFINNDGNLFAYGEANFGFLPDINKKLQDAGSEKRFKNLIGVTLGTGFGGGIVVNGNLLLGDNSNAAEIWLTRNKLYPNANAEESIGVGALKAKYALNADISPVDCPDPGFIFEIALGKKEGNRNAALRAFAEMAVVLGDSLANLVNIIDGLVVLGGGISSAYPLFMDVVINEMNSTLNNTDGKSYNRMPVKAYNLEKEEGLKDFISLKPKKVRYKGSIESLVMDTEDRTGVAVSKLGANKAIALGAYSIALKNLDQ